MISHRSQLDTTPGSAGPCGGTSVLAEVGTVVEVGLLVALVLVTVLLEEEGGGAAAGSGWPKFFSKQYS